MRDFDFQVMQMIQGKNEEEVEEIVLQLCKNYNINYYQCKRYVEELQNKIKY